MCGGWNRPGIELLGSINSRWTRDCGLVGPVLKRSVMTDVVALAMARFFWCYVNFFIATLNFRNLEATKRGLYESIHKNFVYSNPQYPYWINLPSSIMGPLLNELLSPTSKRWNNNNNAHLWNFKMCRLLLWTVFQIDYYLFLCFSRDSL